MIYDNKKVAIVIPLYNDAANVARAIESAASQKLPDGYELEVIVVDDCSTDDSAAIAEQLRSRFSNLKVFRQHTNGGPSAARNRALSETDAGWFTPLDSDDLMKETRVSALLDVALEQDLDFVADNLLMTSEDAPDRAIRPLWPEKPEGVVELTASYFIDRSYNMETQRSELGFLKPLIRRDFLGDQVRPYRDDLRFGEDFELYARMLLDGARAQLVDPAGYFAVVRDGSASHVQSGRDHERLARVSRSLSKRADLTNGQRRAIRGHLTYSEKEWAWWTMIEGVKARNPARMASSLFISPAATGHVFSQLVNQLFLRLRPR